MTLLESQVRSAQQRLWINRWLHAIGWSMAAAATVWTLTICVIRLLGLSWPEIELGYIALGAGVLGSIVWLTITRESTARAAEAVDEAAGLKERVSSSLYCRSVADPFAQAVVQDAQRSIAGIHAARLIPIRWSRSLTYGVCGAALAALCFWLLPRYDLLNQARADEISSRQRQQREIVQAAIAEEVKSLKDVAEAHPDLKDSDALKELDELSRAERMNVPPDALRREAISKLDRLSDQLKDKAQSDRYSALDAMKQMMSRTDPLSDPNSPVSELRDALKEGDYEAAQNALKKMQEQLAKRDRTPKDREQAQQLQKQMQQLAQQMQQLQDQKTAEKMQQAGASPEDVKRMLDALTKKDTKQAEELAKKIQEQMQKQGMTAEQAQQLMEQLKKNQEACGSCNKMGEKLDQAQQAMHQGQSQQAQESMEQAGEMLNDMESLSQELGELETQLSELEELRDELDKQQQQEEQDKCEQCNGRGQKNGKPCPGCGGQGNKGGKGDWAKGRGQGAGARERAEPGDVDFVKKKAKIKTGKGDVIGKMFVKGQQLKGEAQAEFREQSDAAERDATDVINKERVPRSYHKALKTYFDRLGDMPEKEKPPAAAGDSKK